VAAQLVAYRVVLSSTELVSYSTFAGGDYAESDGTAVDCPKEQLSRHFPAGSEKPHAIPTQSGLEPPSFRTNA
jgi:hypothetical protein